MTYFKKIDDREMDVGSIWFTNALFYLDGIVHKQIIDFGERKIPYTYVPSSLHLQKVRVWTTMSSKGTEGAFFLLERITAARYLAFVAMHYTLVDSRGSCKMMVDRIVRS